MEKSHGQSRATRTTARKRILQKRSRVDRPPSGESSQRDGNSGNFQYALHADVELGQERLEGTWEMNRTYLSKSTESLRICSMVIFLFFLQLQFWIGVLAAISVGTSLIASAGTSSSILPPTGSPDSYYI